MKEETYREHLNRLQIEIKELREQLSAQPNLQLTYNQLATDCISRKMAVNAVYWDADAMQTIEELPSIHPEIIYCKDCKHSNKKPIGGDRHWCKIHDAYMMFCSDAERRMDEKNI